MVYILLFLLDKAFLYKMYEASRIKKIIITKGEIVKISIRFFSKRLIIQLIVVTKPLLPFDHILWFIGLILLLFVSTSIMFAFIAGKFTMLSQFSIMTVLLSISVLILFNSFSICIVSSIAFASFRISLNLSSSNRRFLTLFSTL